MPEPIEPSPTAPPAPAATTAKPTTGRWRPVGLLLLLVAFLAVVLFTVRDNSAAVDLKVGDCFDLPSATSVSTVSQHACTEAHSAEVFTVVDYTGDETVVPATIVLDTFVGGACDPVFATYVGKALEAVPVLSIGYFYPSPDAWKGGDRKITCYVARTDQGPMSSSVKGSQGG